MTILVRSSKIRDLQHFRIKIEILHFFGIKNIYRVYTEVDYIFQILHYAQSSH